VVALDWFEPGDRVCLAAVCCRPDGDRWTLTFSRRVGHPAHRVWVALTEPDLLARWAPAVPNRRLDRPGPVLLTVRTGDGDEPVPAQVLRALPPSAVTVATADDEVGWALAPADDGTAVTLRHTFLEPDWAGELAAHWHEHLDALDHLLSGCPAEAAAPPARHLLRLAYGEQLSLAAPWSDPCP
jgi:uncharacterized protein YndB with AHSA1/START domain